MMERATTYGSRGVRALLAAVLVTFALLVVGVVAPAQDAYAEGSGSITLNYVGSDDGQPIANMDIYLFQVASIDGSDYVLTSDFAQFESVLGWNNLRHAVSSDAAWHQQQAETLDGYVRASVPEGHAVSTTNADGAVSFTGLDNGLYLVLEAGDGVHLFTPALIDVGGVESAELVVDPKNSVPFNPVTDIKVVKHWAGDTASAADRPASVKVQLMCDDQKYGDVVELSDANAWTNTWTGLDASVTHKWDVIEIDAPADYAVVVNEDNGTFTITNTLNETPPNTPNTPPEEPEQPEEPTTPGTPTTNTPTPPTTTTVTGRLPQTGQLWWPVPVLFCSGLIAIGAGRIVSTRSSRKS